MNTSVRLLKTYLYRGRYMKPGSWVTVPGHTADKLIARGIAEMGIDWEQNSGDRHVLMVSERCETRATKEAAALRAIGYRVDLVGPRIPQVPDAYDVIKVVPKEAMAEAIVTSGARLLHVHNEPDSLMLTASRSAMGRPIVYDCHDMEWHRAGKGTPDERFAWQRADGIIHTSAEYKDFSRRIGYKSDVPQAVVHSCPLKEWTPDVPEHKARRGVVYEGASRIKGGQWERFRRHHEVVRAFADADVEFTMYTEREAVGAYACARPMVPYMRMLQVLPCYRWGFLGMDVPTSKWNVVMPNKLFEYLMCGVPVIAVNAPAVRSYMKGKAGIYASSMRVAIDRLQSSKTDWEQLVEEAKEHRRYMEDELPELLKVYDTLLGTYTCPECSAILQTKFALDGHIRQGHPALWKQMKSGR